MKKTLKTLAKELDFETGEDYFEYCIDSYINGNFSQCESLFNEMSKADQKTLLSYLNSRSQHFDTTAARNFYFNLL